MLRTLNKLKDIKLHYLLKRYINFAENVHFFIGVNALLQAQSDTVYLSKNFKFQDGVFLSFEDFRNNKPTYKWNEVEAGVHSNPQNFLAQMFGLRVKKMEDKEGEARKSRIINLVRYLRKKDLTEK